MRYEEDVGIVDKSYVIDRILREGFELIEIVGESDYFFVKDKLQFFVRVFGISEDVREPFYVLKGDHMDRFVSWDDSFYEGYVKTESKLDRELEKFNHVDDWLPTLVSEYDEAEELGLDLDTFEGWLFYHVQEEAERDYYGN